MDLLLLLRSLLSRLLFFGHGIVSIYLLTSTKRDMVYWLLALPLLFLVVEVIITIGYRKCLEYKYFWPSGFLYISTIIPIIWIIEMDLLDERLKERDRINTTTSSTESLTNEQAGAYFNAFKLSQEVIGKKVCELGLIIGLITGRWLMPRGEITRDQLSALLLGYVGNAADIIELFETFEEPDIIYEKSVTVGVIAVYTWSIFQFTLVTTATQLDKKMLEDDIEQQKKRRANTNNKIEPLPSEMTTDVREQYIKNLKTKKFADKSKARGRGKGSLKLETKTSNNFQKLTLIDENVRRRALHGEVFQILVTLLMQDGPFLVLRLYLIVQFNITSEMHIFFTCKNAIVSILLVYRLCILTCRGEDEVIDWSREEAAFRLQNVQMAIASETLATRDLYHMHVK